MPSTGVLGPDAFSVHRLGFGAEGMPEPEGKAAPGPVRVLFCMPNFGGGGDTVGVSVLLFMSALLRGVLWAVEAKAEASARSCFFDIVRLILMCGDGEGEMKNQSLRFG